MAKHNKKIRNSIISIVMKNLCTSEFNFSVLSNQSDKFEMKNIVNLYEECIRSEKSARINSLLTLLRKMVIGIHHMMKTLIC